MFAWIGLSLFFLGRSVSCSVTSIMATSMSASDFSSSRFDGSEKVPSLIKVWYLPVILQFCLYYLYFKFTWFYMILLEFASFRTGLILFHFAKIYNPFSNITATYNGAYSHHYYFAEIVCCFPWLARVGYCFKMRFHMIHPLFGIMSYFWIFSCAWADIENSLHWYLYVAFNSNRTRKGKGKGKGKGQFAWKLKWA